MDVFTTPPPAGYSELATFLNQLADDAHRDAQAQHTNATRLRQAAEHFRELAASPARRYMTPAQREQIQELCRHPLLPKARKTLTLVAYMRYDYDQAATCIRELQSETSALDDMRAAA